MGKKNEEKQTQLKLNEHVIAVGTLQNVGWTHLYKIASYQILQRGYERKYGNLHTSPTAV